MEVVNLAQLISNSGGDPEFAHELLQDFNRFIDTRLTTIFHAIEKKEFSTAMCQCTGFLETSRTLGLSRISETLEQMQLSIRRCSQSECFEKFEELIFELSVYDQWVLLNEELTQARSA